MKHILRSPKTLAVILSCLAASAQGAIMLDVSGGGGSVLSITLSAPAYYTVTHDDILTGNGPIFILDEIMESGSPVSGQFTGDMTFSINGVGTYSIVNFSAGFVNEDSTENDFLFYGAIPTLNPGDLVTLNPGTLTTVEAVGFTLSSGSVESFLADGSAARISPNAVPEPAAAILVGLGTAGFALRRRRAI